MRRARLTVKPNIGGPKARQTAAKQTEEGITKVEDASSKTVGSNEIKEGDSFETEGISVIQSDVPPANEVKSGEKRVPVRRLTTKPKPNLPGRGIDRNKITVESITTEPNASATEGFTSIKTSLPESDIPKESIESKAAKLETKMQRKIIVIKQKSYKKKKVPQNLILKIQIQKITKGRVNSSHQDSEVGLRKQGPMSKQLQDPESGF